LYRNSTRGVLVRNEKQIKVSLCTNPRANGANTAPCAGLITIIAASIGIQIQFPNQLT
jgi:hypothetical protein